MRRPRAVHRRLCQAFLELLGHHFPWLQQLPSSRPTPKGLALRRAMPHFATRLIASYNGQDMRVYAAARRG